MSRIRRTPEDVLQFVLSVQEKQNECADACENTLQELQKHVCNYKEALTEGSDSDRQAALWKAYDPKKTMQLLEQVEKGTKTLHDQIRKLDAVRSPPYLHFEQIL